jgi:hypothetical protein
MAKRFLISVSAFGSDERITLMTNIDVSEKVSRKFSQRLAPSCAKDDHAINKMIYRQKKTPKKTACSLLLSAIVIHPSADASTTNLHSSVVQASPLCCSSCSCSCCPLLVLKRYWKEF